MPAWYGSNTHATMAWHGSTCKQQCKQKNCKISTVVWVIFVVNIIPRVALCAKIKRVEFSFLQLQHIYPGSYWTPSHKLGLCRPLHTKYLCKCGSHEHKRLNSSSSIMSCARRRSNIFVCLIFAIMRDRKFFLPWIFILEKFVHVKNTQTMWCVPRHWQQHDGNLDTQTRWQSHMERCSGQISVSIIDQR